MKALAGKIALVTGGLAGFDVAMARALADDGADVMISYAGVAHEADALVREFRARGIRSAAFRTKRCDVYELERLFNLVTKRFGRVDILIWPPAALRDYAHSRRFHSPGAYGCQAEFPNALPSLCS